MAACDYEDCAKCGRGKTLYSADIDWPEGVVVLCPDCASALDIAAAPVAAERDAMQARLAAAEKMAEALRNAEVTIQNLIDVMGTPDQQLCCNGHMCGCMGATVYQEAEYYAGKDLKAIAAALAAWEATR